MEEELELLLDTEAHQARVRFSFPAKTTSRLGHLIDGVVEVAQPPFRLKYRFLCFGHSLDQFGRGVRALQATLAGEAHFLNQEESVEITLTAGAPRRDRLGVCIGLELPACSGVRLRLPGFTLEQSFLRGIAEAIEQFLRSTGVERGHPLLNDGGRPGPRRGKR